MKTFLIVVSLAMPPAMAQVLDPTRPPAEAMVSPAADGDVVPAEPKGPRLESVLVGRGHEGRELAVIDGKIVRRGEKVNGAVLLEVRPNEAVLKRGNKEEILRLFPPVIEGKSAAVKR